MSLNELFKVLGSLRTNLGNLEKDVDTGNSREQTPQDLTQITQGFDEIKEILSSLDKEDMQKIQQEVMELISGQETFQEYVRDVNKILGNVRNKVKGETSVRQKIEKNLPSQFKGKGADKTFASFNEILSTVNGFLDSYLKVSR